MTPERWWQSTLATIVATAIVAGIAAFISATIVFGMQKSSTDSRQDEAIATLKVQYQAIDTKLTQILFAVKGKPDAADGP